MPLLDNHPQYGVRVRPVLKADEQEAKLILPAFELLELLVAAPIESILTAVLAEDLRIAIFQAVSTGRSPSSCRPRAAAQRDCGEYAEWGKAPWV